MSSEILPVRNFWSTALVSGNRLLSPLTSFWISALNSQPRAVRIDCQGSDQENLGSEFVKSLKNKTWGKTKVPAL